MVASLIAVPESGDNHESIGDHVKREMAAPKARGALAGETAASESAFMAGMRQALIGRTVPPEMRGQAVSRARAAAPRGRATGTGQVLRKARPIPAGEAIARRAARSQRKEVVGFLYVAGLEEEIEELRAIEVRLRLGRERDLCHAAFSARMLLQGVADRLFPAQPGVWRDAQGHDHKVGPDAVLNRLSAFVQINLPPRMEPADRRAFQGELDALMRWAGAGPHGARTRREAELAFTRLLSVLTTVANAFGQASVTSARAA